METDDNGTSHGTEHTPLPLDAAEDNGLDAFASGSFEGYDNIDLSGLFDSEQRSENQGASLELDKPPRGPQEQQRQIQQRSDTAPTGIRRGRRPKRPSRPRSAYNMYFKSIRPSLIQEMGGEARFDQLGRIVGERWRQLSDEEKREYEELADKDVIRFRQEMAEYDKERRKRQSDAQKEELRRAREARATPSVVTVSKFPPPPPGQYLGPPPTELLLEHQGRKITLVDRSGHERNFLIQYACYSVKRRDLEAYLAQLPAQTQHHLSPSLQSG